MPPTVVDRARHIKDAISEVRAGLSKRDLDDLLASPLEWPGFKYLLLVISEASRHLPRAWKDLYGPEIDWIGIAAIGNTLRHGYHEVNVQMLWSVYTNDLDPLEAAIDAMLAANPPPPTSS